MTSRGYTAISPATRRSSLPLNADAMVNSVVPRNRRGVLTIAALSFVSVSLLLLTAASELAPTDSKSDVKLLVTPAYRVVRSEEGATPAATSALEFPATTEPTPTLSSVAPTTAAAATTESVLSPTSVDEDATKAPTEAPTPLPTTDVPQPTPTSTEPPQSPTSTPPPPTSLPPATTEPPTPAPTPTTTAPPSPHLRTRTEPLSHRPTLTNPQLSTPSLRTRHDLFDDAISRDRGIILSLHNGNVPLGLSLIKDLRCLGNSELIQVYHCFANELTPYSRELLLQSDTRLEIIDVCTYYIDSGKMTAVQATKFRNWWTKPLALVHTDLREAILLDADAIPLRDPAVLRSLPGYQRTGTTFFYDRVIPAALFLNGDVKGRRGVQILQNLVQKFDYAAFNLTGPAPSSHLLASLSYTKRSAHEMDSSMVAVDKSRAGKALEVLWFLITTTRFESNFSWGDKEAFWLAYELAHVDYFFSPWAASVVSSSTNNDMEDHPETLCGSLAHYLPTDDDTPELLYVNGKALVDPFPQGVDEVRKATKNLLYNAKPTHVTPRQRRAPKKTVVGSSTRRFTDECLVDMGSTPLPPQFRRHLLRRRAFFNGVQLEVLDVLDQCEVGQ